MRGRGRRRIARGRGWPANGWKIRHVGAYRPTKKNPPRANCVAGNGLVEGVVAGLSPIDGRTPRPYQL